MKLIDLIYIVLFTLFLLPSFLMCLLVLLSSLQVIRVQLALWFGPALKLFQTFLYWLLSCVVSITLGYWVVSLILDSIEESNSISAVGDEFHPSTTVTGTLPKVQGETLQIPDGTSNASCQDSGNWVYDALQQNRWWIDPALITVSMVLLLYLSLQSGNSGDGSPSGSPFGTTISSSTDFVRSVGTRRDTGCFGRPHLGEPITREIPVGSTSDLIDLKSTPSGRSRSTFGRLDPLGGSKSCPHISVNSGVSDPYSGRNLFRKIGNPLRWPGNTPSLDHIDRLISKTFK